MTWPVRVALVCVRAYQLVLAPFTGGGCRFHPSCSVYALEAFEQHGFRRGLALTVHRLFRCHPLSRPGIDPVPPRSSV